jgi:hypothetical protein
MGRISPGAHRGVLPEQLDRCDHLERHFVTHIPPPLILGMSARRHHGCGDNVRHYTLGQRCCAQGRVCPMVGIASAWGGFFRYGLVTDLAAGSPTILTNQRHVGQTAGHPQRLGRR